MKYCLFVLLFLIIPILTYSQNGPRKETESELAPDTIKKSVQTILETLKKSDADFYLSDWQGGSIFLDNTTTLPGYMFRYNVYSDQIELRSIVNPENIEYISIGGKIFMYSTYIDKHGSTTAGYFEILVKGDCYLLLRRNLKVTQGDHDVKLYGSPSSTTVIESYYIKKNNQPAVAVDKSKSSLLDNLSDKPKFQDYLDHKILILITENKLIELVDYYNHIN